MARRFLIAVALTMAVTVFQGGAFAQFYEGKTITMIVNFPAGGPTDIEGRIFAKHLAKHIPGSPTIVISNVGGAGGVIGSNRLGMATPNGETIGFFTLAMNDPLLGNPAMRTHYADFILLGGVETSFVVYMRKDTPPGIKAPADLMKANDFKALSLNAQTVNALGMALALELLGVTYQPVPGYRGLKDVETAILQNVGQMATSSLSGWIASVGPIMGELVIPLWQFVRRAKDGSYQRNKALPNLQTFQEFYAAVKPGKPLTGQIAYEALNAINDPQAALKNVALMPPKAPNAAVEPLRAAFVEMWKDKEFLAEYSSIIKSEPILVSADEAGEILSGLAKVRPEFKDYLRKTAKDLTGK